MISWFGISIHLTYSLSFIVIVISEHWELSRALRFPYTLNNEFVLSDKGMCANIVLLGTPGSAK